MKYLIMTEGTCEKAFLDVLLEKNILLFEVNDLLYEEIFKARQLEQSLISKINQLPLNEKVTIIRIGDKLSDELRIPLDVKNKVVSIEKVCIKPEFEILYIIWNNEVEKYNKQKSNEKPSEYIYHIIDDYQKSYKYNYEFFSNLTEKELKFLIKQYDIKRLGTHTSFEKSLLSIIKN